MPAFRKTLPQRYLVSPEIFAQEQERILSTQWLLAGHQNQIAKAGEYFLLDVAGESLIILRDQMGQLRTFYNVCRHRGTRLCEEKTGQLRETLQCPYHAWTYNLEGRLVGAPHMDKVDGFDRSAHSLHAVRLASWEGFIFLNLSEEPRPLEAVFAPLARAPRRYPRSAPTEERLLLAARLSAPVARAPPVRARLRRARDAPRVKQNESRRHRQRMALAAQIASAMR